MSKSLKRKTNLSTLQETPAADNYFTCDVLPGRCRKEFSPGYKEHVLQHEAAPNELPVSKGSVVHHIEHFSIPDTGRQLNKMLFGIIENIIRFLTQYPPWQSIVSANTIEENYNLVRKQIRNDNY